MEPLISVAVSHSPRYSELRQLVFGDNGLTPEEARYLRYLLCDIYLDLISKLPLELVILIALELEPRDFHCCLRVSKAWRRRLLSDSVMLAYANRRWPAVIDGGVNQSRFVETLLRLTGSYGKDNGEWVRFDSKTHFTLDPVFHSQPSNVPDAYTRYPIRPLSGIPRFGDVPLPWYASGKVAWDIPGCAIVIDDLRSKTRKVFTPPSGTMHGSSLMLRSFGSRLAIGTIDRLLIAWDHVDNRAYEKLLPGGVFECATQDSRVAIVLFGGSVITWSPNHRATHLDISCLSLGLGMKPRNICPFFDPRNSKTLYLAASYRFENGMVRVGVHEFSESVHVASWSSDYRDNRPQQWSDYELDYGCILFHSGTTVSSVFDKIKRNFVDVDYYGRNPFKGHFNVYKLRSLDLVDLDINIEVNEEGYHVLQREPYSRNEKCS
ncbi:hypothetical protein F4680DRAFT_78731 [Xylaria scruposa]|nr:hypothetical protein F4680DRAFT_78731 [Xylaria scruposa]